MQIKTLGSRPCGQALDTLGMTPKWHACARRKCDKKLECRNGGPERRLYKHLTRDIRACTHRERLKSCKSVVVWWREEKKLMRGKKL